MLSRHPGPSTCKQTTRQHAHMGTLNCSLFKVCWPYPPCMCAEPCLCPCSTVTDGLLMDRPRVPQPLCSDMNDEDALINIFDCWNDTPEHHKTGAPYSSIQGQVIDEYLCPERPGHRSDSSAYIDPLSLFFRRSKPDRATCQHPPSLQFCCPYSQVPFLPSTSPLPAHAPMVPTSGNTCCLESH